LTQNKAKLCKKFIITLVFDNNANFFRRKLSKIAENCDHNIGPRGTIWGKISPFDRLFTYILWNFSESHKCIKCFATFSTKTVETLENLDKTRVGLHFGRLFQKIIRLRCLSLTEKLSECQVLSNIYIRK
jgi:hypothetical protein